MLHFIISILVVVIAVAVIAIARLASELKSLKASEVKGTKQRKPKVARKATKAVEPKEEVKAVDTKAEEVVSDEPKVETPKVSKSSRKVGDVVEVVRKGKTIKRIWCEKADGTYGWRRLSAVLKERGENVEAADVKEQPNEVENVTTEEVTTTSEVSDKPKTTRTKHTIGDTTTVIRKGKEVVKVWCIKADGTEGWRRKSAVDKEAAETNNTVEQPKEEVVEQPTQEAVEMKKSDMIKTIVEKIAGMKNKAANVKPFRLKVGKTEYTFCQITLEEDKVKAYGAHEGIVKDFNIAAVHFTKESVKNMMDTMKEVGSDKNEPTPSKDEKKNTKKADKKNEQKSETKKLDEAINKVNQKKEDLKAESKKSEGTLISDETHAEMKKIAGGIAKTMNNKKMKSVDVDIDFQGCTIKAVVIKESGLALTVKKGNEQKVFNVEFMIDKKNAKIMNIETLKTIQRMVNECAGNGKKTA